jgi:hypothetical protein
MEEDHPTTPQQGPFPDQAQFIEHGVPIMISVDEDAVVGSVQIRERIEAVALFDCDSWIARVLERKVGIEAGVHDRI